MSELNRLKVVDFTMGRSDSDEVNTNLPFADNFEKTRTIQQANVVLGAYVNRNYNDMQNKADKDEIPTKLSELENDAGYITEGDIPSKTSDLVNDGEDGEHPFITKEVDNLTNYTDNTTLNNTIGTINNNIGTNTTDISNIKSAIDYKNTKYMGDVTVESIKTKNLFDKRAIITPGYINATGTLITTDATLSCGSVYIKVKPNTTYTISSTSNTIYRIAEYNSSKIFIQRIYNQSDSLSYTFTTSSNTQYIKMAGTLTTALASLQIEEGNSSSTYTNYQDLNNNEIYSNSEIVIGSWIDGKPLYRKVYKTNTYSASNDISISNVKTVTNVRGFVQRSDYTDIYQNIPGRTNNANFYTQFNNITINPTYVTVAIEFGSSLQSLINEIDIIIEYTKTTD